MIRKTGDATSTAAVRRSNVGLTTPRAACRRGVGCGVRRRDDANDSALQLRLQARGSHTQQEAPFAEITIGLECQRHKVGIVDNANERNHPIALECDFLRLARFEHLRGALNRLDNNTHFSSDRFDIEHGLGTAIRLERNPLEVHQQACKSTLRAFDYVCQRLLEHDYQPSRFRKRREFLVDNSALNGLVADARGRFEPQSKMRRLAISFQGCGNCIRPIVTVRFMRFALLSIGIALVLSTALGPRQSYAQEASDEPEGETTTGSDDSAGARRKSESSETSSLAESKDSGKQPGEPDRSFPHAGQFSLRVGFVGAYRIVSRFDSSPYCENPVPADPQQIKKFCGFGAPPAIDVALGYAPFNSLEAFAWGRFGVVGESQTNTLPLVALGIGARLYTLNDSAFKFFIQPAVGWELEKGAGNPNWRRTEYKQDLLMQLLAGPQFDFTSGIGADAAAGITAGIFRAIQTWMEFDLGVQARFP
jgi:hypothetical protein